MKHYDASMIGNAAYDRGYKNGSKFDMYYDPPYHYGHVDKNHYHAGFEAGRLVVIDKKKQKTQKKT